MTHVRPEYEVIVKNRGRRFMGAFPRNEGHQHVSAILER